MTLVGSALVALVVSFASVAWLRRALPRLGVLDQPGSRSSHRVPTPRGGGLGILLGFLAGVGYALWQSGTTAPAAAPPQLATMGGLAGAGLLVAAVGFLDDLRSQPAILRLAIQGAAAALLISIIGAVDVIRLPLAGEVRLGMLAVPATALWLVAVTNIYNFMDGIDGLAAGQAAIASGFLALAGVLAGNPLVAALSCSLGAAAAGFLGHNFPPARVFMGDVGSTFLGFTFAGLAVLGAQAGEGRISIYVSALLIAPFLFDGTLTLLRRIARGERWYEAHRSHLYQRLVQGGYSHRQVSLVYYLLAAVLGALGVLELTTAQGATEVFMILGLAPLVLLALWVRRVEAKRTRAVGMAEQVMKPR